MRDHYPRRLLAAGLVLAAWAGLVAGCATNPATGKRQISLVSAGQEKELGRQEDTKILAEYGMYGDSTLVRYVENVGAKLAAVSELPNLGWHFRLLDSEVVNAFALPGGYIYITRGILAALNSEAQLAGVMGHEIGHVTARHTASRITKQQLLGVGLLAGTILSSDVARYGDVLQQGAGLLLLKFSRDDETQADELGIRYAVKAGYDPREIPRTYDMLARLSERSGGGLPSWMSTHPDPGDRKVRTSTLSNQAVLANQDRTFMVNADGYKKRLDGMVYGVDPNNGYLVNNVFYHPGLNIEVTWPNGWKVENTAAAVTAVAPAGDGAIQLTMEDSKDGPDTAPEYVAWLEQKGEIAGAHGRAQVINGMKAWVGQVIPKSGNAGDQMAVAFIEKGQGSFYQFIGIPGATSAAGRFDNTVTSLGPIRDQARRTARPDLVGLVTAPGTKSFDQLMGLEKNLAVPQDELAWLNNLYGKDTPSKGDILKLVRRQ